jgi:hypothetical protein
MDITFLTAELKSCRNFWKGVRVDWGYEEGIQNLLHGFNEVQVEFPDYKIPKITIVQPPAVLHSREYYTCCNYRQKQINRANKRLNRAARLAVKLEELTL